MIIYFFLICTSCTKEHFVIDYLVLVIPHCAILLLVLVSMWSIKVDVLRYVTLVDHFIICFNSKVLQNSKYFFNSEGNLFVLFIVLLFSSPIIVPSSYTYLLISPKMCYSSFSIFSVVNCLTMFPETLIDLWVCI